LNSMVIDWPASDLTALSSGRRDLCLFLSSRIAALDSALIAADPKLDD
jgi:hypothetical protein